MTYEAVETVRECKCLDPWTNHPEGFTWTTPTGKPWWHTPWGLA